MLPGAVSNLEGELASPSSIQVKWAEPEEGGPIDGYKIIYWKPNQDPEVIPVDKDVSFIY